MQSKTAVAKVSFPVVARGRACLIELAVESMPPLDRQEAFCGGHRRPETLDVLLDARAGESKGRRFDGISLRFMDREFSGSSYGLALALADKRARYPLAVVGRSLIATGEIAKGGSGRINRIDGFSAKVDTVLAALDSSSPQVFAFPHDNWMELSSDDQARLLAAERAGAVVLLKARTLADLDDLWAAPRKVRRWLMPWIIAASVLTVLAFAGGAGYGVFEIYRTPARTCARLAEELDPVTERNSPDLIARTAKVCDAAARRWPDDGRLQFLAGQALQLNGSRTLAEDFWHRAANLKDIDGMTTWGRHLWLTSAGDRGKVLRARTLLRAAAEAGAAAAMDDLADLESDGRVVPADPADAKRWRAEAAHLEGPQ